MNAPSKTNREKTDRERFLKLAVKAVRKIASVAERKELETLMKQSPGFRDDYRWISTDVTEEMYEELLELCLRVLFRTATNKETAYIRSLAKSKPEQWQEFQQLAFVLQVVGESQSAAKASPLEPESMPKAVSERIHSALKVKRNQRESKN